MISLLKPIVELPLFGIFLTIGCYILSHYIAEKVDKPFVTTLWVTIAMVITFLVVTGIELEDYQKGGHMISFLVAPMTLALAVPMYNRRHIIAEHFVPIIGAIVVGSAAALLSGYLLGKLVGLDMKLIASLLPKNTTTGVAVELCHHMGGDSALTIALVIIVGNAGYMLAPGLYKLFRIKHPVAKGVALGTASHAMGTRRALEIGETEGAVASAALGICGMITTLILPLFLRFIF